MPEVELSHTFRYSDMLLYRPAVSKITLIFLFLLIFITKLITALPEAAPSLPSSGSGSQSDSNQQLPPFNIHLKKADIFAQPDLEGPIVLLTFESANVNNINAEDGKNNSGGLYFSTTLGNSARFRSSEYRRNRPPTLGPDGELIPPPSRVPLPPSLVQTWRRVVWVDLDDVDGDEDFDKLLDGGRDSSGKSPYIKFEVWLYNYRGPKDFTVRIKLAET